MYVRGVRKEMNNIFIGKIIYIQYIFHFGNPAVSEIETRGFPSSLHNEFGSITIIFNFIL